MFKIIVTVYLLMNGQPFGEPVKFMNKPTFKTVEECIVVKDSDANQAALSVLRAMIEDGKPEGASYTMTVSCEKIEKADNGSI
jgi:hypothetical protein